IGDEAFQLDTNTMKPYSHRNATPAQRVFNYRLSRARRVVENSFGLLAARFRVLERPIPLRPCVVDKLVLAACVLHNFLRDKCSGMYVPGGTLDEENVEEGVVRAGNWRNDVSHELRGIGKQGSNAHERSAGHMRDALCSYFNNE